MPMFRNSAPRSSNLALAALIVLLSCWSGGCAKRAVYVNGDRQLIKLNQGQPAPRDGILISEQYLSEIFEKLE